MKSAQIPQTEHLVSKGHSYLIADRKFFLNTFTICKLAQAKGIFRLFKFFAGFLYLIFYFGAFQDYVSLE